MSEVKPLLTEEQIFKLHDEVDRRLEAARQWKRGVEDCGWCGQRDADRNEHPCLIAAETSGAYVESERDATVRQLQQENKILRQSAPRCVDCGVVIASHCTTCLRLWAS